MPKHWLFILLFAFALMANAQVQRDSTKTVLDSLESKKVVKSIGEGFFPTKIWNFDLRYLIKYNQYEALRTGIGGVTNGDFLKNFRIDSYVVYGFRDHRFKYKIGGGFKLIPESKTWLNISYNDDLQETGSSTFLTDGRKFSFFEPRLLNIELFHKHITWATSLEHEIKPNLYTEAFTQYEEAEGKTKITKEGYPKFSFQYTKNLKNVFDANFNFSKLDLKAIHKITHNENSFSSIRLSAGIANGDTPLTHLYHAYPNNNSKETILQRFSVAGINSFETMYFNEFFSDRFATVVLKHYIKPFKIFKGFNPQLVLITRYAIGDISNIDRHQDITFGTLDKGYTESGFEINKLLLGFGLSFTYRYGGYHLPDIEDNMALKFTFNITL